MRAIILLVLCFLNGFSTAYAMKREHEDDRGFREIEHDVIGLSDFTIKLATTDQTTGQEERYKISVSKLWMFKYSGFFQEEINKALEIKEIELTKDYIEKNLVPSFIDALRILHKRDSEQKTAKAFREMIIVAVEKLKSNYVAKKLSAKFKDINDKEKAQICLGLYDTHEGLAHHEIFSGNFTDLIKEYVQKTFGSTKAIFSDLEGGFFSLPYQAVLSIMESDITIVDSENSLFLAACRWAFKDLEKRGPHLPKILSHIRYPQMLKCFLFYMVPKIADLFPEEIKLVIMLARGEAFAAHGVGFQNYQKSQKGACAKQFARRSISPPNPYVLNIVLPLNVDKLKCNASDGKKILLHPVQNFCGYKFCCFIELDKINNDDSGDFNLSLVAQCDCEIPLKQFFPILVVQLSISVLYHPINKGKTIVSKKEVAYGPKGNRIKAGICTLQSLSQENLSDITFSTQIEIRDFEEGSPYHF
jgi:hypothetical protein